MSALARRLERLEAARKARETIATLVLLGTEQDIAEQLDQAIADGRYKPGAPLMRIVMEPPKPIGESK